MNSVASIKSLGWVRWIVLITFCTAISVMAGWLIDIPVILHVVKGYPTMKFNTALMFALVSIAMNFYVRPDKRYSYVILIINLIVIVFCLITFLEYFIKFPFSLDQVFIKDPYQLNYPGRMSEGTAICFVLAGIAMTVKNFKETVSLQIFQAATFIISLIALLSLIAGLLQIAADRRIFFINTMAIHTSILFLLCFIAISQKNTSLGFIGLLGGRWTGSKLMRWMVPFIVLIPLILSQVVLFFARKDYINSDFGIAVYTVIYIFLGLIYISINAIRLNRADAENEKTQLLLNKYVKRLEYQNNELEQFTFITSHDLQEPLRTTLGIIKLLKLEYNDKLDQQANQYLKFLTESNDRMQELVTGLLLYSQIGKERSMADVDCNEVLNEIRSKLTTQIEESGAQIVQEKLPVIYGYMNELHLLFENLVSNALKFCKPGFVPEVTITASKETDVWKFCVADKGLGINKKYVEKIFEIFKRLHGRKHYYGTGIGLAHCRKIVHVHGGEIWVESSLGEGSSFYFTIPLKGPTMHTS